MKKIYNYRYLLSVALTAFMLELAVPAKAQYDIGYTHYMFNEFFINPAYTGAKDAFSVSLLARDQWVGFKGAPRTIAFNAHTPLAQDQIGLGIGSAYEHIGVNSRTMAYFNFAYRIHLSKGIWALGMQGGFGWQDNRYDELENLPDDYYIDPLLAIGPSRFLFNAGTGTYYYTPRFFIGFSIPRFFNNDYIEGENKRFDISDWTYYLESGYVFRLGEEVQLMPSAMLKLTLGVRPQVNISALSLLYNTFWLGADYRTDNTLALMAGIQINKSFRLAYSYDMNLYSDVRTSLENSHEISLSYTFDFFQHRVTSPRLF